MNSVLDELIQKIHIVLKDCLVSGLESGDLTVEGSERAADLIEQNMSQIESRGELLLFTDDLAKRFPSFQKAFIAVKQHSTAEKDKNKLDALQAKLRSFTSFSPPTNGS